MPFSWVAQPLDVSSQELRTTTYFLLHPRLPSPAGSLVPGLSLSPANMALPAPPQQPSPPCEQSCLLALLLCDALPLRLSTLAKLSPIHRSFAGKVYIKRFVAVVCLLVFDDSGSQTETRELVSSYLRNFPAWVRSCHHRRKSPESPSSARWQN